MVRILSIIFVSFVMLSSTQAHQPSGQEGDCEKRIYPYEGNTRRFVNGYEPAFPNAKIKNRAIPVYIAKKEEYEEGKWDFERPSIRAWKLCHLHIDSQVLRINPLREDQDPSKYEYTAIYLGFFPKTREPIFGLVKTDYLGEYDRNPEREPTIQEFRRKK